MTRRDPFGPFLEAQRFVVLDGGLATALEAAGHSLDTPLWSARLLLDTPDAIRDVHSDYLLAGADCITSTGYQASIPGLLSAGLDRAAAEYALRLAVDIAVATRDAYWADGASRAGRLRPLVAASAGPYGAYLADGSEYRGDYGVDRDVLERFHAERLAVLADTDADVVAFETVPSGLEAQAIARVLSNRPDVPAWVSFSCRDGDSLRDGTAVADAAREFVSLESVVALGVNCTAPRHVGSLVARIAEVTDLPVIAYPNSGEDFDAGLGCWVGEPDAWVDQVGGWVEAGARVIGGCCRVGPARIRELRELSDRDA